MILGVGIDLVQTARCADWRSLSDAALAKWLTMSEIAYCREHEALFAQRCAARLAAKEAFYKAFTPLNSERKTLFEVSRALSIVHIDQNAPEIRCDWNMLVAENQLQFCSTMVIHLSISHTDAIATAIVILEAEKLEIKRSLLDNAA